MYEGIILICEVSLFLCHTWNFQTYMPFTMKITLIKTAQGDSRISPFQWVMHDPSMWGATRAHASWVG